MVWLGVQGEGSLRHVMWRPIERAAWEPPVAGDPGLEWVEADDLETQRRLLAEGSIGVRMRDGKAAIGFARPPGP